MQNIIFSRRFLIVCVSKLEIPCQLWKLYIGQNARAFFKHLKRLLSGVNKNARAFVQYISMYFAVISTIS